MKLEKLVRYFDDLLDINSIADDSPNGLQVEGGREVKKIGFAVDYSPELAMKAVSKGVSMIFLHHGIIWGSIQRITGINAQFLRPLIKNDISLYVAHLPLDVHPQLSHNAVMCRRLGLKEVSSFGAYKGIEIGLIGSLDYVMTRDEVVQLIKEHISPEVQILPFGGDKINKIAIVSGGGASLAEDAKMSGADLFLTGETSHSNYFKIQALQLNTCFAGHYHTEKWGILAIMDHVKEEGIADVEFFDLSCPF